MRAYERFLKYAKIHTTSAEEQGVTPSTPCQWDLARVLVDEMKELGMGNCRYQLLDIDHGDCPLTLAEAVKDVVPFQAEP